MKAEEPAVSAASQSERARRYAWLYDDEDLWAPLPVPADEGPLADRGR